MEIREALNEVFIEGILKEKNLETTVVKTENGNQDVIRGEVVITTGKNAEHRIRIYANKLTKEKKDNPVYKGLVTVMEEYVSIADALKNGQTEDQATKVRITKGKLSLNEYYTPTGELRSFPAVNTNFLNRVDETKGYNPKAEFTVEMFFKAIKKEVKDNEETGRVIVDGIIPMYGGAVIPISFVVVDEDTINYLETNYEIGKTGKIWGEIINTVEITKQIEKGFGKSKEKIITNILHELIITGGEEEQYDEDDEKSYSVDLIKKALTERDIYLDELKNKIKKDDKKSSSSGNKSFGNKSDKPKKELNF